MNTSDAANNSRLPRDARDRFWLLLFVAGLGAWIILGWTVDAHRAWRALLVNFLFFSSLACGMVTWPAVVLASRGTWMKQMESSALAGISFAPASVVALIALWIGGAWWAPWVTHTELPWKWWLNPTFLFARDLAALLVFWLLAAWFVRRRLAKAETRLAGWFIFAFCIVFSLLGFDLVMALYPHWYSSLFGGYFFISAMYIAVCGWTFVTLRNPVDVLQSSDLGKLVVAFSILTTYMMYSQLLPIWYENLPHETLYVVPRMNFNPWKALSIFLVASVYLGPLVILLTRWSKRTRPFLRGVCLAMLICLWIERWWLVTPALDRRMAYDGPGRVIAGVAVHVAITASFLGLFTLGLRRFHRQIPPGYFQEAR
jgi:hypothetical protein